MDISILIPNSRDMRMERMIKSIDFYNTDEHHVELVIVLNQPTDEIRKLCERLVVEYKNKFEIKIIEVPCFNFGLIYNQGVLNATYDNVVFIDTDLVCGKGAVKKVVELAENDKEAMVVKAKIVYSNMNSFVERARFLNTTDVEPPYIPVILIRKSVFLKLKDNYMFPVDTVWCADADFAYRVLNEKVKILYSDATFYHDKITIKKDLKDALMYGFGKGIRVKRTKEKWRPFREIKEMYIRGKNENLSVLENLYSTLWISLQQITCGIQQLIPNIFKASMPFYMSSDYKQMKGE